ncbi:MAG: outer membrane protein assembly factor BamA [Acidobacteria bacterium]|nr:outer membrane protein assembly factor BamA [Acidobacteriota bacterium]
MSAAGIWFWLFRLLVSIAVIEFWEPLVLAQSEDLIENIEIRGTRRVPQDTVRFHVLSQRNMKLDPNLLRRDFKTVWNQGFFDDLKITIEDGKTGKIVIFWVKEKPLIREIKYTGLKSATNTEVLDKFKEKKVGLGIETPFDPTKIQRAIAVLTELLAEKGRQYAEVRYETTEVPPNSKLITFLITEGPKVKVKKIDFHGNTLFSDRELRKSMKYVKQTGLISTFTGKSTFDRNKLEGSLELGVRAKYHESGYIKLLIKEPKIDVRDIGGVSLFPIPLKPWKGKRVFIDIDLEEGSQYRVGEVNFTGNTLFTKEVLLRIFGMQQGEVFNGELIRKGFENLKKIYGSRGYINWTPIPRQDIDDETKLVNIVFDFEEGNQYFLRRLDFVGNTTTRDKVIRREVLVNEGEVFSTQLLDVSLLRLNQLGFFDQLKPEDAEQKPGPKPTIEADGKEKYWVDVTMKVKEKGKNSIGFTGGVSGVGGNFLGLNYSTNNFMGYGETLDFTVQGGTRQSAYVFSFTEPYFRDRPLTTGFSVFHRRFSFREGDTLGGFFGAVPLGNELFGQGSTGFSVFASYPIRPFTRFGITYSLDNSSTEFASEQNRTLFSAFQFTDTFTGFGNFTGLLRSKIIPTITYNTVDNPFTPRSGKSLTALVQLTGGPLGGDVKFYQPFVEAKWFKPMNRRRNTLGMRGLFSFVSGFGGLSAPIFDRAFIGGEDSIRGFDIRSLSPLALVSQRTFVQATRRDPTGAPVIDPTTGGTIGNSVPLISSFITPVGGDTQVVYNIEYRIPIVGPVTLAPFFDIGKAWVWRKSQLRIADSAVNNLFKFENGSFRPFRGGEQIDLVPGSSKARATTGVELQVVLPVINAPFRLIFGYNPLRFEGIIPRPEGGFPFLFRDANRREIKFSVGRTF